MFNMRKEGIVKEGQHESPKSLKSVHPHKLVKRKRKELDFLFADSVISSGIRDR